ncbi:MAG TPA: EF-hand domain-containing protein [Steroidobacter sp.]
MNQADASNSSRRLADIEELQRDFAAADLDHDNRIDFTEFTRLLEGLQAGMSRDEMRIGFQEVDVDKDGLIDCEEFIEWWSSD